MNADNSGVPRQRRCLRDESPFLTNTGGGRILCGGVTAHSLLGSGNGIAGDHVKDLGVCVDDCGNYWIWKYKEFGELAPQLKFPLRRVWFGRTAVFNIINIGSITSPRKAVELWIGWPFACFLCI